MVNILRWGIFVYKQSVHSHLTPNTHSSVDDHLGIGAIGLTHVHERLEVVRPHVLGYQVVDGQVTGRYLVQPVRLEELFQIFNGVEEQPDTAKASGWVSLPCDLRSSKETIEEKKQVT
jgi:hypothetical protein